MVKKVGVPSRPDMNEFKTEAINRAHRKVNDPSMCNVNPLTSEFLLS